MTFPRIHSTNHRLTSPAVLSLESMSLPALGHRTCAALQLHISDGDPLDPVGSTFHFMGFNGISWDLMGFHGISWELMGVNGISWELMGFHGISWDFMGYTMVLLFGKRLQFANWKMARSK